MNNTNEVSKEFSKDREINLIELVNVVLKRWWMIFILVIIAGVASYVYTDLRITPLYTATGTLYISVDKAVDGFDNFVSAVDYNDIMSARELTKTYMQILSSKTFFEEVISESGLDIEPTKAQKMVSFSNKDETLIIQVNAMGPVPKDAATLVETVLNCSQAEISRVITGGRVKIIDHPVIPKFPSYPSKKKNTFFAVIIAFVIGTALAVFLELFDDTIKNLDIISEKYNIPVLGEIPCITDTQSMGNHYSQAYATKTRTKSKK